MDLGNCSEAEMTGQTNDIIRANLDKCTEIAEMGFFKLIDHLSQLDQTHQIPYYKRVKTKDEIAKEGFPKFRKLPAELRSRVWENVMPPHGVYTALMLGREEPRPQQPPPPAPLAFRVVYRLEPVPRNQQGDDLRMRLDTMRAIQRICSEAASEVQRVFPTTINCTRGKLRFNADHDTLSLSDRQCLYEIGFDKRFERYSQGAVVFVDDWHKIPRKMLFSGPKYYLFTHLFRWLGRPQHSLHQGEPYSQYVEGFMKFLADCSRLRTFGFMYSRICDFMIMQLQYSSLTTLHYQVLPFCDLAPRMHPLFYGNNWRENNPHLLVDFAAGIQGLDAIVHGLRPGQELPSNWLGMRFGRPELQHIHFEAVLPADAGLYQQVERAVEERVEPGRDVS